MLRVQNITGCDGWSQKPCVLWDQTLATSVKKILWPLFGAAYKGHKKAHRELHNQE